MFWLIFICIFTGLSTNRMKRTFAQRLKSIRLRRGLSMEQLANLLNNKISKQAISKYEQGKMLPDDKVLDLLAAVLEIEKEYFFRPINITLKEVKFRPGHLLGKKEEETIQAEVIDFVEPYLELENILGINTHFENVLKKETVQTPEDIENAVLKLRHYWQVGLQPIHNTVELLENEHIKVLETDQLAGTFDGLLALVNSAIPVIVLDHSLSNLKMRVVVLRELAFLLLEHTCVNSEMASYFANAFLLPKPAFLEEVGLRRKSISVQELIKIKEYYGIPMANIIERAATLGVIPISISNRFRKFMKTRLVDPGKPGLGKFKGEEKSGRFEQLLHKAIAEEVISLSKAATLAKVSEEKLKSDLHLF